MGMPTEAKVFPDDEFNPAHHSPILPFLLKHLGETPRQAGFDPDGNHEELSRPVDRACALVALQRFWEEKQQRGDKPARGEKSWPEMETELIQAMENQIEIESRLNQQTERYGSRDYAAIGIGLEAGMASTMDMFKVIMSPKNLPPGRDIAADLRLKQAEVRGEDVSEAKRKARVYFEAGCPFCQETFANQQSINAVHLHVLAAHPKNFTKEWPELRLALKEEKAAWDKEQALAA